MRDGSRSIAWRAATASVLVFALACRTSAPAPPTITRTNDPTPDVGIKAADAATGDDARRILIGALAAPHDGGVSARCRIEPMIEDYLVGEKPERCGALDYDAQPAASEALRSCMLRAIASKASFSAWWYGRGIDSVVAWGWAGRTVGNTYRVRQFTYDGCPSGCGNGDPHVYVRECRGVVDLRTRCSDAGQGANAIPVDGLARACAAMAYSKDANPFPALYCDEARELPGCP